jgi:hypothetical protein
VVLVRASSLRPLEPPEAYKPVPRRGCVTSTGRSAARADKTSGELDVYWPDFGLTATPNADNCRALLCNILAGQR